MNATRRAPSGGGRALLQRFEGVPSSLIESDYLTVQDDVVALTRLAQAQQFGIARRGIDTVASHELDASVMDPGQEADAVPFQLEGPLGVVCGHRGGERGEHRAEGPRRSDRRRGVGV